MSFDDTQDVLVLPPDGLLACACDAYPYGSPGRIVSQATVAELEANGFTVDGGTSPEQTLYLFAFQDGRPSEYVWRSNLYPVPLESGTVLSNANGTNKP